MLRRIAMAKELLVLFLICSNWRLGQVEGSADIMKQISMGFHKALDECKEELNVQDHIIKDLFNYWNENYSLLNRDFGCTIICMANKFNLMDPEGTLHHGNTANFAKKHGADNEMASQLVSIIHNCSNDDPDPCIKVLEMAKCFRTKIHELNWVPSMGVVIEEVFMEV